MLQSQSRPGFWRAIFGGALATPLWPLPSGVMALEMWSGRFGSPRTGCIANDWRTHFSAAQQVPLLCGTSGLGPRSWARAPPPRRARRPPPAASARPSSREVRCGAARRLRSVTPAWEASALAARPPSGDLRVARLPCRFLVRERALTLLHFRLASLRSLRVEEAAGVQVQDALAPVLQVRPSRRSPSRRAATEPSTTVPGPSPRPPARPPVASRQPPTSPCTVPRTSVPRAG